MSIYNYLVQKPNGEILSMQTFKGKIMLIVNTASKCRFTYQFEELQKLYDRYQAKDFVILGFPCNQFGDQNPEDGTDSNIFCQRNYGVAFPMFEKVEVNGDKTASLFNYLKHEVPYRELSDESIEEKVLKMKLKEEYPEYLIGNNIRWNFTKFLVASNGEVIKRFEPTDSILDIEKEVDNQIASAIH
ncbi:glutathione peroxidase [Rummeliibacillus suwonensis]|uniref:glutathione peroxidase n=1 Tax=Rummeliibacillus suwonensis TaxID=1306154 RepID=UPI001AAEA0F0|nr:glutathione peroxidase [Rummeliibacillus suwonensis]MBO2536623.1 glutathione peroxidase [Rummeliibacillus suwonensis]